jgi:hypothetical protein
LKIADRQRKQYLQELKVKNRDISAHVERNQHEDDMEVINAGRNKSKAVIKAANKGKATGKKSAPKRAVEHQAVALHKYCGDPLPQNSDDESENTRLARFNITKDSLTNKKVKQQVLLVAPDTSSCAIFDECDATTSEDAETVVTINNHRHYEGEEPEFLVTFDNGERIWSTRNNVYVDNGDLLSQYLVKRGLLDSDFEPPKMKQQRRRQKKDTSVKTTTDDSNVSNDNENGDVAENTTTVESVVNIVKEDQPMASVKNSKSKKRNNCRGKHDLYSFNDELNAKYCATGNHYCGVKCAKCKREFVDTSKKVSEAPDKYVCPTATKPMKTCPNRISRACPYAVCFACFQQFVAEDTKPVPRSRRNQQTE